MLTTPTPEPWFANATPTAAPARFLITLRETRFGWFWSLARDPADGEPYTVEDGHEAYPTAARAALAAQAAMVRHRVGCA